MRRKWVSEGQKQLLESAAFDKTPEYDVRTGDHLWIVATMYRVTPENWGDKTHTPMLDSENLLTIQGPGCFYCEQPWSPLLASRRCKGDPR